MNKNGRKVAKISLSTFFLILAIIVVIVMGIFIYKLYNEKIIETEKSAELQTQVNNLDGTVSDLQDKISSISDTIKSNSSDDNTNKTGDSTKDTTTNNSIKYQITGTYNPKSEGQTDAPTYIFSANNKVTYASNWSCSGTYTINNIIIKINFTNAMDPDGNKANIKDFGVNEYVELTIIDNNTLKDKTDGYVYSK